MSSLTCDFMLEVSEEFLLEGGFAGRAWLGIFRSCHGCGWSDETPILNVMNDPKKREQDQSP